MASVKFEAAWLRETRGWLTNRAAWPERLGNLAFLLIASGLVVLSVNWLSLGQSVFLWSIYVLVLGVCSWLGWIKLLGPVLFYDMVRTSRRNRYFIMRMLYAGFLFFILAYMVLIAYIMQREIPQRGFQQREYAMLAEMFFMVFMLVQMTLVVLLTPAYVAGAISEEKDRKTIEFMLATDLRNREIVLSKFLSRLGNMTLLLLTGLPILSILQFLGGVDTDLMLVGFTAIGLTMLGVGSISILFSTLFKKPRDAISLTYLLMIAYAALATTGWVFQRMPGTGRFMGAPLWFGDDPLTISDTIGMLNAGNPLVVVMDVTQAIGGRRGGGNLASVLPGILERYAWFHLTLTAVCVTWSILHLRSIALKQTTAGESAKVRWWQGLRPPVTDFPMLWKEIFVDGRTKLNWLIWIAVAVLILLTLGSGLWVLGFHLDDNFNRGGRFWDHLGDSMNIWFRIAGTFVACLMLLMTGVRASTAITSERERSTFDALVTTPMSADGMLFAKLVGNITGMKLGWVWFGALLLLAIFTGGIHIVAVPIVLAACFIYAVFMSMLGLMFSVYCRSSLQSATFTVLTTILLGGGHWIITSCFCAPLFGALFGLLNMRFNLPHEVQRMVEETALYFVKFQAGMTPPFVFPWCSVSYRQMDDQMRFADRNFWEFSAACVLGLFVWGGLAVLLWFFLLVRKFRHITRRIELE